MPSLIVGAVFIPGTWLVYLAVRWVLTHFDLNLGDKVALSFLPALAYLVGQIVVAANREAADRQAKRNGNQD